MTAELVDPAQRVPGLASTVSTTFRGILYQGTLYRALTTYLSTRVFNVFSTHTVLSALCLEYFTHGIVPNLSLFELYCLFKHRRSIVNAIKYSSSGFQQCFLGLNKPSHIRVVIPHAILSNNDNIACQVKEI